MTTTAAVAIGLRKSTEDSTFVRVGVSAMLGLFGGRFFALQLVPDWMRLVGHLSPHAWAVDGFSQLVSTNAGVSALLVPLAVLAGLAAVLFLYSIRRFRRVFGE